MSLVNGPHCEGCAMRTVGERFVPSVGTGSSSILICADSPWYEEIATGRPFSGAAGSMLDRLLRRVGIERDSLKIINTIQCRPPRLGWMDNAANIPEAQAAIDHCKPHLDDVIESMHPKVIVPMGNVALNRICGVSDIATRQAYFTPTPYNIWAIPTFHPSYIMQGNQKYTPVFVFAMRRAVEIANNSVVPSKFKLILDPSPMELQNYVSTLPAHISDLVVDIETPDSTGLDEEELE